MPNFVRLYEPGGKYFFTVVMHRRRPILTTALGHRLLRQAWRDTAARLPFQTDAVCLLPDHLHCLWTLPEGDKDFSSRWRSIKTAFTRGFLESGGRRGQRTAAQRRRGRAGIWQERFWEHRICDDNDYARRFDYIHYNPVKHELVTWPEEWPWSTYHRYARKGWYDPGCGREEPPDLRGFNPHGKA